jgi:hypothetical protein
MVMRKKALHKAEQNYPPFKAHYNFLKGLFTSYVFRVTLISNYIQVNSAKRHSNHMKRFVVCFKNSILLALLILPFFSNYNVQANAIESPKEQKHATSGALLRRYVAKFYDSVIGRKSKLEKARKKAELRQKETDLVQKKALLQEQAREAYQETNRLRLEIAAREARITDLAQKIKGVYLELRQT